MENESPQENGSCYTMSLTRSIAHNTMIQIIGKGLSTVLGLIVLRLLAEHYDKEGLGYYGTVLAFTQFFGIVVDLGLYIILLKKISEPDADVDRITSNAFTLRLISAIVFLGIAPIVVLFFPYDPIEKMGVAIISFSFLFITLGQLLTGIFQKHLAMAKVAVAENLGRVVLLGGTIFAIESGRSLLAIFTAISLGSFVNFLALFLMSRAYVKISLAFDWGMWKNIALDALPIALSIAFNLVYFKADTLILRYYHGAGAVGVYTLPYKVLENIVSLPAVFAGLLLPHLTRSFAEKNMARFQKVMQKGVDAMALLALPMIVGTWFIAEPLMRVAGSKHFDYLASVPALNRLIVATGIIFVGNLFGNAVVAVRRQRQMIWGYFAVAVISVAGYFLFIPRYGTIGAANMTIVAEALIMFVAAGMVFATTRIHLEFGKIAKIVFSAAVMGSVLYLARDLNAVLIVLIGAAVYCGMAVGTRAVSRDMLRDIFSLKT